MIVETFLTTRSLESTLLVHDQLIYIDPVRRSIPLSLSVDCRSLAFNSMPVSKAVCLSFLNTHSIELICSHTLDRSKYLLWLVCQRSMHLSGAAQGVVILLPDHSLIRWCRWLCACLGCRADPADLRLGHLIILYRQICCLFPCALLASSTASATLLGWWCFDSTV